MCYSLFPNNSHTLKSRVAGAVYRYNLSNMLVRERAVPPVEKGALLPPPSLTLRSHALADPPPSLTVRLLSMQLRARAARRANLILLVRLAPYLATLFKLLYCL